MHLFRHLSVSGNDRNPADGGAPNQDNVFVTPENQPGAIVANHERLLRAPRVPPRVPRLQPRPPFRRRHFSDSMQAIVPPQVPQLPHANQNRDQLQPASGQPLNLASLGQQFARSVIGFASGYSNTRAQQRRLIHTKSLSSSNDVLSLANPLRYGQSFENAVRPKKFDAILRMPPLSAMELESHAWNPEDRSTNIFVKEDGLTLHRHPIAQSTDSIRGKVGYSRGFHVWQMTWPVAQRGTHPMVGIATKKAPLQKSGYVSLVGSDCESYGWDINKNKCYHDSAITKGWAYPHNDVIGLKYEFKLPDKFYCILDMDEGYMSFATPDAYLGVAFKGLKGKTLFPIVSAVWGHCEIRMQYMGGMEPIPRQLMDVCRRAIRSRASTRKANEMDLPSKLRQYLCYKW